MPNRKNNGAGESVRRGNVHLCNMVNQGGRLWKDRPVLVIQNDAGNQFSSETIVLAIRDAKQRGPLPVLVPVRRGRGGLRKDSVIDAAQFLTLLKSELGKRIGSMDQAVLRQVDRAIRISLAL